MRLLQCLLYKNDCYSANRKINPTHIVVHSTGANNDWVGRYVQPHDEQTTGMEEYKPVRKSYTHGQMLDILGTNYYGNHWNCSGLKVCVHAFIGRLADGSIATVQTLPWKVRPWGCSSGKNGSYNDCAIQFEICEDDHRSSEYCRKTFEEAAELCAHLCKSFNIPVDHIVSHNEAHVLGYASGHNDPDNWWPRHGLSMKKFRDRVSALLRPTNDDLEPVITPEDDEQLYRIRSSWEDKTSQIGAYTKLDNAIKACPAGYSVYDKNGKVVHTNKPTSANYKTEPAKSKMDSLSGTYIVKANGGLNLRIGAGTNHTSIEIMPNGSKVKCYGYYTADWLYVVSASGKIGFACKEYLVKAD